MKLIPLGVHHREGRSDPDAPSSVAASTPQLSELPKAVRKRRTRKVSCASWVRRSVVVGRGVNVVGKQQPDDAERATQYH